MLTAKENAAQEKGKSLRGLVYPSTIKRSNLLLKLYKTGQITPRAVLDGVLLQGVIWYALHE
jgi:hypothetical protein